MSALLLLALLVQPDQGHVIGGRVVDAVTNQPLSRVTLELAPTSERTKTISTKSSNSGAFRFENLGAAKYLLVGAHPRYVKQAFGQRALNSNYSTAIVTGPTETTDDLIFRMIPSAVIAGTVHDEFGEGLAGLDVLAYRISGFGNQKRLHLAGRDSTNDLGHFRIHSLSAGSYLIAVTGKPWQFSTSPTEAGHIMGYAPTFHPGTASAERSTLIEARAGRETNARIVVRPTPVLPEILGEYLGKGGGAQLRALLSTPLLYGAEIYVGDFATLAGQTFRFSGVPPGDYLLSILAATGIQARKKVTIDQGTTRIQIGETPPASVRVKLNVLGTKNNDAKEIFVALLEMEGKVREPRPVDNEGFATFPGLTTGRYQVVVAGGREQLAILSVTAKGAEARAGIVDIPETGQVDLVVNADASAAQLEGRVFRNGSPQPGVIVVLAPINDWENTAMYRFDQSDSDGTFRWLKVPPGEYMTFAFEEGEAIDYMDPEVFRSRIKEGQLLTVSTESIQNVRLELPAIP